MTDGATTLFGGGAASHRTERHAGRTVARALRRHGTEVVFTLCGGHILPVLDGCIDEGIRVVDTRHEQAAVLMAEGYAYASRRTAVAAVTAGPGFTNAVTGIADANHSGVPLVVLGGRTPVTSWNRGAIQDIDQLAIARLIAKRAEVCVDPARLDAYVAEAFREAATPRHGVAYIDLPTDVLLSEPSPDPDTAPAATPPLPVPDRRAVDALVALLTSAERPVVLCGSGAFWGGADEALRAFAERTQIPVTTTGPARGLLPDSHPSCLGSLVHGGVAVAVADVVVVVGSRFDGNLLFGGPPLFGDQTIAQIDVRPGAFGGNRTPDVAVVGDAAATLRLVTEAWTAPPASAWLEQARSFAADSRDSWSTESRAEVSGVHPGALALEVDAAVSSRGGAHTLVADGGDILTWAIAHFRAEQPAGILTTGTALGTLGVGIPFALGAKAARRDDLVVCLVGDGTLGLQAMEIDTSVRAGLPIVIVVSNNGAWADVQHEQDSWFGPGRTIASELAVTPWERVADDLGAVGFTVDGPDDLRAALDDACAAAEAGRTALVDVRTDPTVVSEILRGIGQLGVM